jgi:poly(ADP-ribose) glycohydrolase ARH3
MRATPTLQQFQGALLGLAVADALGAPWEGMDAYLIFDLGPAEKIVQHATNARLTYTDDTQMTIGVAQALVAQGRIDIDELAAVFAANYHPDRGYGQGARQIINAIGFGEDWKSLTKNIFAGQGSLGNGAAMRVSPIGLFFSSDIDRLTGEAALSARTTHQHPLGIDSARIMAIAIALAAGSFGHRFSRSAFLQGLLQHAETEEFQWQIRHALELKPFQSLSTFGNSLEAHRSVMTSILCFADCPDDYSQAIERAIGQGNDVDTLAAMTGALVGSRLGIECIPRNLLDCLEDDYQGKSYLLDLSKQLHAKAVGASP